MKRLLLLGIFCIGSMSGMHADNGAKGKKYNHTARSYMTPVTTQYGFNDLYSSLLRITPLMVHGLIPGQ